MVSKNEIYKDPQTSCKTRHKVKIISCRGECSTNPNLAPNQKHQTDNELDSFKLLDKSAKFSYLIGTNKRDTQLTRPFVGASSVCCQVVKRRSKKIKLYCPDGSSYVSEIEIIKKCADL